MVADEDIDWKAAYQVEHEEHKKTLLMLQKTMEESDQIFVNTRDMVRFMERIMSGEFSPTLNKPQPDKNRGGGGVPL